MDHVEMNITDENKLSTIRKKSSFLRDGSYRIFSITKKPKEDSDGDDDNQNNNNNNIDQTIDKKNNKSLKITNRNGLKQFLFLHKTTRESSSIELKTSPSTHHHQTNEISQSIICLDKTSVKLLKKNKQHVKRKNMTHWSQTNIIDETIIDNNLSSVRADKFQPIRRKQVSINIHPEIQTSFHRRRKRFIVACGTVLVALSIIITIIIYVSIMTIQHITQMNQLHFYDHRR